MAAVADFLNELASKGVKLSLEGEELNCYAQKGALTKEIKEALARYKPEIVQIFRSKRVAPRKPWVPPQRSTAKVTEFPLSVGQKTHYLLQQMNPTQSLVVPICLGLRRTVDVQALAAAWDCVLEQYPLLTARIVDRNGVPWQILDTNCRTSVQEGRLEIEEPDELLLHLQERVRQPFDLRTGPLVRIELLTRGGADSILLIAVHHVIFDGFSIGVLLASLFGFYKEILAGNDVALREDMAGYHEFVAWEENLLASEEGRGHADYWREQLRGELPGFRLLSQGTVAAPARAAGHIVIENLPEDLSAAVGELALSSTLQPSVIFLGTFQLLLHKYTHQEESIVVMPAIVRPAEKFFDEIGYFFNILPIRTRFDAGAPFEKFLRNVQGTVMDALIHSSFPFTHMLDRQGKGSADAEFPVFFAFQNLKNLSAAGARELKEEVGVTAFPGFHAQPQGDFDLSLEITESYGPYRLQFESKADRYSQEFLRTLFEHYCVLLRAITTDSRRPIDEYSIVTEREKRKLVWGNNMTQAEYPRDMCIHELFAERVGIDPWAVAAVYGDEQLSYQELYDRSRELSLYLQSEGVGPDSVVGLCVERSLDMMVGILGIVQAGGAYLPLDPDYPDERLAYMLGDSEASVVLTQERFQERIGGLLTKPAAVVALDAHWPRIRERVAELTKRQVELREEVRSHHISYVIYTSGSTGRPKGVLVEHRALVNRINWMQKSYPLSKEDVVLQKTPYSFDVSVWEFFWPMMSGASVVFAAPDGHRDVHYLERLINQAQVTTLHYVPSMLHAFLDHAKGQCGSVRRIFCSGEALDKKSVDRYRTRFPHAELYNLYGPTEAAIDVTAYDCTKLCYPFVPIGAPIDNTQIYILDRHNNLTPVSVPGELHIAGDGLARGYLNRPELTQEKFIANPFIGGTRMYKTGDLACWLEDGNIQYLGRIDVQVKLGGVRIEVGEIEAALNQQLDVSESVVIAHGETGYKQLVAFYRARATTADSLVDLGHAELRAHLIKTLPEYMVPVAYVSLTRIPLSSNGKADRKALEQIEVSVESSQEYLAPRNDTEQQLADLWAEVFKEHGFVLGQTEIGVNDDFFELGGNSLLVTQLIYKIRWHLGVEVPVKALFEQTTIAQMAEYVLGLEKSGIPLEEQSVDLDAEVGLDVDIELAVGAVNYADARAVFLTGASGFLGAYLLHELLTTSAAPVYCLIRARNLEEGSKRLRTNLENYRLWQESFAARIIPVPGDLSRPLLGMEPRDFEALSAQVDAVYHNGAWVNFIYPYGNLKDSNVGGTVETIRLASLGRHKPLHYISTGGVFAPRTDRTSRILESDLLTDWRGVTGGYAQSKWVAEKIVALAGRRGLPVRIYRPGSVTGDSTTGICNTGDFIPRMIKGCLQLGVAPDTDAMLGMVPVDYVSKAIVHLSRRNILASNVFHVVNPSYVAVTELGRIFDSLGLPLKVVPYAEWRGVLFEDARRSAKNALYPLLPMFTEDTPLEREPPFDCAQTLAGIDGSPIVCPPVDASLMGTYVGYFRASRFIEA